MSALFPIFAANSGSAGTLARHRCGRGRPRSQAYNRNNMTVRGYRKKAQHMRFNMIFNERAAVVYQFSPRYFAGATLVMNNSVFDDEAVVVNQNKWRARAFIGVRIGK